MRIVSDLRDVLVSTRSYILIVLSLVGGISVKSLSKIIKKSYSTTYEHIDILRDAKLITIKRGMGRKGNSVKLNINVLPHSQLVKERLENWDEYREEMERKRDTFIGYEKSIMDQISP